MRAEQRTGDCNRRQAVGGILSTAGLLSFLPRRAMATSGGCPAAVWRWCHAAFACHSSLCFRNEPFRA